MLELVGFVFVDDNSLVETGLSSETILEVSVQHQEATHW